jgi:hypothetical protein
VASAADHPWCTSPTTQSRGMRASVRNTSLNDEWKFIWRSDRTSTPGWRIGRTK